MSAPGNYLFWVSVTHFVPQVGFFSTMFFGTVLLFLNLVGAGNVFKNYKVLMSCFTLLGMAFATVEIIVYPNVHNYKRGLLYFSFNESFWLTGPKSKNIPLAGYTFFHSATMALLSVQFIYRYWCVFSPAKLIYFKGHNILLWIVYTAYFGFQYSLGIYYFLQLDPVSSEYFKEEIQTRYYVNIDDIPATAILAYDPVNDSIRWRNMMGVINICGIVNLQYAVMIYCGWQMHTQMEEKIANFSPTLRRHHKQFFKTLVLQITAPTIILFIPISIIILLPLFDLNISFPSGVLPCCFTLYPAMDALIVLCVVSEYQRTVKNILITIRTTWKELKRRNHAKDTTGTRETIHH